MLQSGKSLIPDFTKQAARILDAMHRTLIQQCYIPYFQQISRSMIIKY